MVEVMLKWQCCKYGLSSKTESETSTNSVLDSSCIVHYNYEIFQQDWGAWTPGLDQHY